MLRPLSVRLLQSADKKPSTAPHHRLSPRLPQTLVLVPDQHGALGEECQRLLHLCQARIQLSLVPPRARPLYHKWQRLRQDHTHSAHCEAQAASPASQTALTQDPESRRVKRGPGLDAVFCRAAVWGVSALALQYSSGCQPFRPPVARPCAAMQGRDGTCCGWARPQHLCTGQDSMCRNRVVPGSAYPARRACGPARPASPCAPAPAGRACRWVSARPPSPPATCPQAQPTTNRQAFHSSARHPGTDAGNACIRKVC